MENVFRYVNNDLSSVINFNHIKRRYIEPCNFLTKRALVSQQSTLMVAEDLTFRIIAIYQSICQQLSLPLHNTRLT